MFVENTGGRRKKGIGKGKALREMFGNTRKEMTEGSRTLHNEDRDKVYSSLNTIRVIKARRMRWARHVAQLEEKKLRARRDIPEEY
jgi:hypothetical protein